jgi:two-component system, OmpR family, response regulator
MKILIVDDDITFLETIKQRLELRGIEVLAATSGKQALEILNRETADAVILDVSMPEMNGLETLREIRAKDSSLPVLMLTGHASLRTAEEGIAMGATDYLCKPFPMDDLVEQIREYLAAGRKSKI